MTHTPTPWRVEADMRTSWDHSSRSYIGDEYCVGYNIVAEDGTEIVGVEGITDANDKNAAFIVRAVNSHERLVEALKLTKTFDVPLWFSDTVTAALEGL